MFMKHYAPNRCEPSIEVFMKMGSNGGGGGGSGGRVFFFFGRGGVRVDVNANEGLKLL